MGVDYRATAGYGVQVKGNLTEKGQELLEEKYGDCLEKFIYEELSEFEYDYIGCEYSGTDEPIIILEDPLENNTLDKFNQFKLDLEKYKHLLEDITPEWVCEVYVF